MKQFVFFLLILGFYKFHFGQNDCSDFVMSIKDFESKSIMISGTNDSLLKKMGEPFKVKAHSNYGIADSIYNSDGKTKFHYYDIDVDFNYYDGMIYACYNDSVQLYWIDFTKTQDTLDVGKISFYKGLYLDTLLNTCQMDTSCVSSAFDWYYLSNTRMHQVFFYSKHIVLLGFHFYFDMETRMLWYAKFDLQKGDGIIR